VGIEGLQWLRIALDERIERPMRLVNDAVKIIRRTNLDGAFYM